MIARRAALTVAGFAIAATSVGAQTAGGSALSWLSGCWQRETPSSITIEEWTESIAGTMLGTSRTIADERVVAWEFLRIQEEGGGATYWAHPSGQTPTDFHASAASPDSTTFANPEHDFPQAITYRQRGDSLIASIEGEGPEGTRRIYFRFGRVDCRP